MRSKRGPYRVRRHEVIQPPDKSYRLIPLTQGQNAIVDAEDFEWLSHWNWCAGWDGASKTFYAQRGIRKKGKTKIIKMHREILQCRHGEFCDHANHNGLDNRKANLRKCTNAENARNARPKKSNRTGFKGVLIAARCKFRKYTADITFERQRHLLGYFRSAEEAAHAYDEAAKKFHGRFAFLNFPNKS